MKNLKDRKQKVKSSGEDLEAILSKPYVLRYKP